MRRNLFRQLLHQLDLIAELEETIDRLKQAFPPHFEHMFAAKANTLLRALELVRRCGMGCEVASPGELEQALRAGFEPAQIVFDEPAKTSAVLRRVLELGVNLNIDNFQEFERVRSIALELGLHRLDPSD